jgi:hypothetical protein
LDERQEYAETKKALVAVNKKKMNKAVKLVVQAES